MAYNKEEFLKQLSKLYKKEDGNLDDFKVEKKALSNILDALTTKLKNSYKIEEPIGRGGAGIVIKVLEKSIDTYRALKFPRPIPNNLNIIDTVINESGLLTEIDHSNIIKIYHMGKIEFAGFNRALPFFIMEYIENAQDLLKYVMNSLVTLKKHNGLKDLTLGLADIFQSIITALEFLHVEKNIIHFDVKPTNILMKGNIPIISDLGFAQKKTNSKIKTMVGFTLFYAHNNLKDDYTKQSSKNRVQKPVAPANYKYIWDVYATGKTILEILGVIKNKLEDEVLYDYNFVYTHLMACRMLDGLNLSDRAIERIEQKHIAENSFTGISKETWMNLEVDDFDGLKYKHITEVKNDLQKLNNKLDIFYKVQEINIFFEKRIQISDGLPAPFTKRVKKIIEHPTFSRLMYVRQLGIANTLYPTATHNRLEHSIGTFRNCCLYILYLINDPFNPIFRQLVNDYDIKCILLASLVHDLGQFPLAHELEEYIPDLKHENFSISFLDNKSKDNEGHTLEDIIKNKEWGWGIEQLADIKKIIRINYREKQEKKTKEGETMPMFKEEEISRGETLPFKLKLMNSIVDGPIDPDKLDYLLRDSHNCFLTYGNLIDVERLIRNLTVIIVVDQDDDSGRKKIPIIGTYEKGQSAAEALTFARYLLYQSVYWHHTIRSIRTMLCVALNQALKKEKEESEKSFIEELKSVVGLNSEANNITIEDVLSLIDSYCDESGKELIDMIKKRTYYKRILTIPNDADKFRGKKSSWHKFRDVRKENNFQDELQKEITEKYTESFNKIKNTQSSISESDHLKTIELLEKPNMILTDCPEPEYGSDEELRIIPEPARLLKNYTKRIAIGDRVSSVWMYVHHVLMNIASKGRIYCHPKLRDQLMTILGPDKIQKCVDELCNKLLPRKS